MATQNRRGYGNPYGSTDLGSGVRTTTGGTYRNPRLAIQDTTAFGRGFASTFRMPDLKEEEKQKLKVGDLNISSEKGNEWYEKNGVINPLNSDLGVILNNNWKNDKEYGGAAYWQNEFETGDDQRKGTALGILNGYNQAFGPKDSNFGKYMAVIGDGKLVDRDVSNVYLPGLDGKDTTLTMADISEASQNNPSRFKYAHEEYRGIMRFGLKDSKTGQFINVTAMDDAWVEDNIKDRYDIETSLAAGYENFQISRQSYESFSEGTNLFAGTADEFKVKRTGDYYQTKDIANFDGIAIDAARKEVRAMVTDDLMPSAFGQMRKKLNSGEFSLTTELEEQYEALNVNDEDYEDNYREWRNATVQDYYTEQFKLKNGSKYYAKGDDGRAIARTKENKDFFERDYMKTERNLTEETGEIAFGSGNVTGNEEYYASALQSVFGVESDGEWIKGGPGTKIVDGKMSVDDGLSFISEWAKNKHGKTAQAFNAEGVINHIKNYWNYDKLGDEGTSKKKGKDDVDEDIKTILKNKSIYYYMKPATTVGEIGVFNPATQFGNISESQMDIFLAGKSTPLVVDAKNLMSTYRNNLENKNEKDLFESAATKLGINLYGYKPPKK